MKTRAEVTEGTVIGEISCIFREKKKLQNNPFCHAFTERGKFLVFFFFTGNCFKGLKHGCQQLLWQG